MSLSFRHNLFAFWFLVPPTVRAVPQNGLVTARKGSTVTLECKASGNPVPSIYWYKRDPLAGSTHLSDSSTLVLDRVERQHAGVYQCAADNGVREPVSADVQLTVLCKYHATYLSCFVTSSPVHSMPTRATWATIVKQVHKKVSLNKLHYKLLRIYKWFLTLIVLNSQNRSIPNVFCLFNTISFSAGKNG